MKGKRKRRLPPGKRQQRRPASPARKARRQDDRSGEIGQGSGEYFFRLPGAEVGEPGGQPGIAQRQHGDREQRGIDRAGFAHGEGGDGDAAWHLHHRQQGIQSLQVFGGHGYGEHGLFLLGATLAIGALFTAWLTASVGKLPQMKSLAGVAA